MKPYDSSIKGQELIYKQGLPNTGNICYLNSIVQFLYSSQIFKAMIEESSLKKQKTSLIYLLYKVFFSISTGGFIQKEESLYMLIRKIQQIDKNIQCHSQQDFFQVLMIILNEIFEEYPPFENLFTISIESSCSCSKYQSLRYYLPYFQQRCGRCKHVVQTKILKNSPLIIIKIQKDQVRYAEPIKQISQNIFYQCTGKIFYFGNSYQGHYLASRLYKDNYFSFSDRSVYTETEEYPMVLLYQTMTFNSSEINHDMLKNDETKPQNLINQIKSFGAYSKKTCYVGGKYQIQLHQNDQITMSPAYHSQVYIVVKVTASKVVKRPRQLYYQFQITKKKMQYHVRMYFINKDCFVKLPYNFKIIYVPLGCLNIQAQEFLKLFEGQINKQIEKFYRQKRHKHEQTQQYSTQYYFKQLQLEKYKALNALAIHRTP